MPKDRLIPEHWEESSWEEKARENPLHAIMTVPQFQNKDLSDLDAEAPVEFLEKGRLIYSRMIEPYLTDAEKRRPLLMFDYGCGAGRIINAAMESGHKVIGADISQTMLDACRRIVPRVEGLRLVSGDGKVDLPDNACDVAYSFAVLQHIKSLSAHERAIAEMARVVKPDGLLSIQVNCDDFTERLEGELGHTVNFEDFSVHFQTPEGGPVRAHEQNNWSGVYVGIDRLVTQLNREGFHVCEIFGWNEKKPRAIVVIARKAPAGNALGPRPNPFATVSWVVYRALLKKYASAVIMASRYKRALKQFEEGKSSE